jgi:hypothetical protein
LGKTPGLKVRKDTCRLGDWLDLVAKLGKLHVKALGFDFGRAAVEVVGAEP